MSIASKRSGMREIREPTFAELYAPKLITVLREGYSFADFRADAISGLTVAIVALPLSMAIAIASGVSPGRGLYTAVIGGFIVSLLGGSRFQIGGPAGAFIVLVALTVERHGIDGVILAAAIAGVFLIAAGFSAARHLHQIHSLSGDGGFHRRDRRHYLRQPVQGSPRDYTDDKGAGRIDSEAGGAGGRAAYRQCFSGCRGGRQHRHHRRAAKAATALARHPDRGGCSRRWRRWHWRCRWKPSAPASAASPANPRRRRGPLFSIGKARAVLPDAIAFALLARDRVAAVGGRGRRHDRPPSSLQLRIGGAGRRQYRLRAVRWHLRHRADRANFATNVRAGARGPVAGMLHSVFLLLFMLIAAPLASYIPLAALAAVLVDRRLEHGREARIRDPDPLLARRRDRAARDLSADDLPRSHRGHRGRLRARRGAAHQPDGRR